MTPCSIVCGYECFGWICCLHYQGRTYIHFLSGSSRRGGSRFLINVSNQCQNTGDHNPSLQLVLCLEKIVKITDCKTKEIWYLVVAVAWAVGYVPAHCHRKASSLSLHTFWVNLNKLSTTDRWTLLNDCPNFMKKLTILHHPHAVILLAIHCAACFPTIHDSSLNSRCLSGNSDTANTLELATVCSP
jgi:hypothetical protein